MTLRTTLTRVALASLVYVALYFAERKWPLRRFMDAGLRRVAVNLAIGALAFSAVGVIYGSVVVGALTWSERNAFGLIRVFGASGWVAGLLAVVLLDYTLWHWHWLNHRVGFLWRMHAAHHADLDLDASTALRFHPGELLLSVPYRALQVSLLGVSAGPLVVWETLVLVFILFHHSNLQLPRRLEDALGKFVITPRVHGIHHSRRPRELHSNFGTLLSWWDRLHRSRVVDVPQATIEVGLPKQSARALGLSDALLLPFRREAPPR